MEVKAYLNNLRISARKVRLAANLIRGLDVSEAKVQLKFLPKRAAEPILKLLNSAIANAENNFKLSKDNLYVFKIFVDSGPILKRWMPRAFGRTAMIKKRTSHITIILDEKAASKIKAKAKKAEPKEKELEKPFEEIKKDTAIKGAARKGWQEIKKSDKITPKKKGLGGLAGRIFRRKSI